MGQAPQKLLEFAQAELELACSVTVKQKQTPLFNIERLESTIVTSSSPTQGFHFIGE